MTEDIAVPLRYYARLLELLAADGHDPEVLRRHLQLSASRLREADATLPFSRIDRLLQKLSAESIRSDIAFDVGKNITASAHSFVGFGMLNSATVDQALHFEARYFRLVMPTFVMRYHCGTHDAEIRFEPRVAMSRISLNFHLEAIGAATLREIQDLYGGHRPPCRLEHSLTEPAHAHRYSEELRNVTVVFGVQSTPGIRVRIFDNLRERILSLADRHARQAAEDRCRALVQREAARGNFADWIAMTLREVSDELPSLDELASNLSISRRSLNRYLEREGTSFRQLAGRIQHQIACERLTVGGMSPTNVAYSLGFSDPSNFAKAFQRYAGCTPGTFRKQYRQNPRPA